MYNYFTIVDLYFITSKSKFKKEKKPDSCMNKTQPCVIKKRLYLSLGTKVLFRERPTQKLSLLINQN